ncbi:MAG: hypothetical protein WA659_00665 [Candidatus Aquirickettsiella sp.]
MHPEMDFYWMPLSTPPYLLESDIDLIQKALTILLHPIAENSSTPPESIPIAQALNNYLRECNNAFLASERIRGFLLLSLLASLIIAFISLVSLPVTAVSITLICIVSFILFSVNLFTLFNQITGYQQEVNWNKLKLHCSEYRDKLDSGEFKTSNLNNQLEKTSSPTIAPCLFSAKKISTDNNRLNHTEHRLSATDENLYEASIESNAGRHLISFN